ncbi:MAG: S1 RNA-binding domain-containing protein [archaeon]
MVEYPKIADTVICKVTKITDYGVFVSLLEYDGIEGFVHVSQVSSTWVKNIHNHAKQNQIRAGKVLHIDTYKNQIDISFNRVTAAEEKRKISDYRLFKRAQSLLSAVAKELDISDDVVWSDVAEPILEKETSLYTGFINILKNGIDYYPEINKKYAVKLIDILTKSITIKDKKIIGHLEISNPTENGVEIIKKALKKVTDEHESAIITYVASGKYELSVTAKDYKTASKQFNEITDSLAKQLKGSNLKVIPQEKKLQN